MADEPTYGDWRSLEAAIKDAAKRRARDAGAGFSAVTIDAQVRQARYDRFLSRVFAEGSESEWLLKGGLGMLARVPKSRTTKDVDLAAPSTVDLDEAERKLSALVSVDLGDHLTFRLARSAPSGLGENQPGVAMRRLAYDCLDSEYDVRVDGVTVDLVVGPTPVGRPEILDPANRLHLRRPLVTYPYRLYPLADQIADKVCATMSTAYPGGRRSSRVKDLVDLVVLARSQTVDLTELRKAIIAKQILTGMDEFHSFDIPSGWHRTYRSTAIGVPLAQSHTAESAAAVIATFLAPALGNNEATGTWDPRSLRWVASQ